LPFFAGTTLELFAGSMCGFEKEKKDLHTIIKQTSQFLQDKQPIIASFILISSLLKMKYKIQNSSNKININ
jgi:hypothetical protein